MKENEIINHEHVPQHTVLKKDEAQKILKEMDITPNQLPKILDTDPVIDLIGAKIGDIIKIDRESPTAGTTKYYRIVIPE